MIDSSAPPKKNKYLIHSDEDFAAMRKAGQLAAECLDFITPYVKPGVTTDFLDQCCHDFTIQQGGIPAPLNYRGFPKSICTSINHVVCHGIPSQRKLEEGDIVNIDVTPILKGWHGDSSRMFYVGKVGVKAKKLCEVTYESLMRAIQVVRPGATIGDIGFAIQNYVESFNFSVVKDFCGHGIGKTFHTPPNILHYGRKGEGDFLVKGMIFTIEPMINAGKAETKILSDGWTAVTKDRSLSAQFEHTIGVTDEGCEIFTLSPKGWHCPPYA
jgi:methionyl aminopeptidase